LHAAQETQNEVNELLPAAQAEWEEWEYALSIANSREEYETAIHEFEKRDATLSALNERLDLANGVVESMEADIPDLRQALEDATRAKTEFNDWVKQNAGETAGFPEYDPETDGPPSLPEEPAAADGSTTGDGSATDGSSTDGSATDGSATDGSSTDGSSTTAP